MTRRKTKRRKPLKAGTRIRLKVPDLFGWKGTGTVIYDVIGDEDDAIVEFRPDDKNLEMGIACRHEVAVLRDQTPPKQ